MTSDRIRMVVATGNPHKLRELRTLLAHLPVELIGLKDLPAELGYESPEETGTTFEANADLKAVHAAQASGLPAIADDSGLEVDALDGRPGVYSARYAGEGATDLDNNRKLLAEATEAGLARPLARFRCVVSLAAPSGEVLARGHGACEGMLIEEARGGGGFGYDPHFYVEEFGATFAEIGPSKKNSMSHRSRALADLDTKLPTVLKGLRA